MMNKDYKKREQIIFGEDYDEERYFGECRWFKDMSVQTLKRLVAEGFADPKDRQNGAPAIGKLLEYGEANEGAVTFDGYAISIKRDDYRVSIDTIKQVFEKSDDAAEFNKKFRLADELNVTANSGRAWWD